jgi:predicted nucleotide-binding protein
MMAAGSPRGHSKQVPTIGNIVFAEPTINDYLALIERPLQGAIERARKAVEQVEHDATRTGQTGRSVALIFEAVRKEFNAGIQTTLGHLRRVTRDTSLDRSELRQLTVQRLMNFVIAAKSVTKADRLKRLAGSSGLAAYVDEQLAAFDRDLQFEVRQFDVGLSAPTEPEPPSAPDGSSMASNPARSPHATQAGKVQPMPNNDVFIVHGRDGTAKTELARFVERAGLHAVILHEQPNAGRTIIEKFEAHGGSAGFAVVLLTPDDVGGRDEKSLSPRARQNVIGEMFWFAGKLGRNRVCALKKGDVEIPSDFTGVVYTDMDDHGNWRSELLKELDAAGYSVDWKKALA